jgi:hypothetical protein
MAMHLSQSLTPTPPPPLPGACPYCRVCHGLRVPCPKYLALHRAAVALEPLPDVDALVAQAAEVLSQAHRAALSASVGRNIDLIEEARENCLRWLGEG